MKKETVKINLELDKEKYEFLKSCKGGTVPSVSFIIRIAIDHYIEGIGAAVRTPISQETVKVNSLTIPVTRTISPSQYDIMKAKRAKEAGRPYDTSLEPYFGQLDGLIRESEQNS